MTSPTPTPAPPVPPANPPSDLVSSIQQQVPGISAQDVNAVMAAWNHVVEGGDPPGMVRRDATTGTVAHRVVLNGINQWVISPPNEPIHYDRTDNALTWTIVFNPNATA